MSRKQFLPFVLFALLASAAVAISAADIPRVGRPLMASVESNVDNRISHLWVDNPLSLVGPSRGVYLEGYGVVLSAEVLLMQAPPVNPMSAPVQQQKSEVHRIKMERLPKLKAAMKEVLVASAASLDPVPADQMIVFAVFLPRYSWEDASGLPLQLIMQCSKQQLLAAQHSGGAGLDQAIKITEY